jgi:hypothetical protein
MDANRDDDSVHNELSTVRMMSKHPGPDGSGQSSYGPSDNVRLRKSHGVISRAAVLYVCQFVATQPVRTDHAHLA